MYTLLGTRRLMYCPCPQESVPPGGSFEGAELPAPATPDPLPGPQVICVLTNVCEALTYLNYSNRPPLVSLPFGCSSPTGLRILNVRVNIILGLRNPQDFTQHYLCMCVYVHFSGKGPFLFSFFFPPPHVNKAVFSKDVPISNT